jgi:cell division protein FtsZ
MGSGSSQGSSAAYDAAKAAIDSPLLDNISINGAKGVLVHFHIHPDYPILQISDAMDIIEEHADEDASVIFGTTTSEEIEIDEVRITIVATGFEDPESLPKPSSSVEKAKEVEEMMAAKAEVAKNASAQESKTRPYIPNTVSRASHGLKVMGGDLTTDDELDVPTFLRKQMD